MRGGPISFHPRTNASTAKGIGINGYQYQWKGQTNLNADTAALSSPFRACSTELDAAVASCASPNAENPTAKTDRVSKAMTVMTATLAFIYPGHSFKVDCSVSVAQFYTGLPAIATTVKPPSAAHEVRSRVEVPGSRAC